MPCRQVSTFSGTAASSGSYRTEADCLNACKEGACCNGTTCSVKPQCQCNAAAGEVFKGVGTVCSPNPAVIYLTLSGFLPGPSGLTVNGTYALNRLGATSTYGATFNFEATAPCSASASSIFRFSVSLSELILLWAEPLIIPSGSFAGQTRCSDVYARYAWQDSKYLGFLSCETPEVVAEVGDALFIPRGLVDLEEGLLAHPRPTSSGQGKFSFSLSRPPNPLP